MYFRLIEILSTKSIEQNKIRVSISPMKTFSKTFNFPMGQKVLQNKELLQTMQEIAEREQEYMREKLMRQQELQNRLKLLENVYVAQTMKKEQKIKQKLEKSEKNRHQFLEKIVKRCQDKQKFLEDKLKTTASKRKQSLRDAWKAATKFNQKILENKINRHKSLDKGSIMQKSETEQNINKSLLIPPNINDQNRLHVPSNRGENSKMINQSHGNRSPFKSHNGIHHSTFFIENKFQKLNKPISIQINSTDRNCTTEENPQNPLYEKLRRTLIRHQQNLMTEQNKKIQQFGQRLQKINISRRKRDELHKSRIKKSMDESKVNYEDDFYKKRAEKVNKKHSQRMKSQSQSCNRSKRASDWSEINKQRRQKFFQKQLEQGNRYLSENKIRFLKQMMAKDIAYNALEKKLYEERQRHQ